MLLAIGPFLSLYGVGPIEQNGLLIDEANMPAVPGRIEGFDVDTVQQDLTLRWIVKALNQMNLSYHAL